MVNFNELFEQFNRLIDKPLDYNQLLVKSLVDAQGLVSVQVVNGVPVFQDAIRSKTLSLARPVFTASAFGNNMSDRYLKIGEVPAQGSQGMVMPRDATITGLWAKSRSTGNWTIEIRKNGIPLSLVGLAISGGQGADPNVDMDLNAGDVLQVFANGSNMSHIVAGIEVAWRVA